jgi:hypothetical protein
MANPIIQIDQVIREMTAEEFTEYKLQEKLMVDKQLEVEAKVAARESALAKLAKLGLTADEVAAL